MKNLFTLFSITVIYMFQIALAQPGNQSKFVYQKPQQFEEGVLHVFLKEGIKNLDKFIFQEKYRVTNVERLFQLSSPKLDRYYKIEFSNHKLANEFLTELEKSTFVISAENVPLFGDLATPNDYQSSKQWGIEKINAFKAWNLTKGGEDIVVAVVDDAIDINHEDLSPNIWTNPNEIPNNGIDDDANGYVDDVHGYDVADDDNDPTPPSATVSKSNFSHGTHCAGIVSAATNNSKGVASIGYSTKIMAVKTKLSATSGGSLSHTFYGVQYAIAAGADVISMSFGSYYRSNSMEALLNYGREQGIVLVGAAGNSNTDSPMFPGSYESVINVGASDQNDKRAYFSNYGPTIDVMAPGVSIYSTIGGGKGDLYAYMSGTSMACPMVSGLVGLMLSVNKNMSPEEVKTCLTHNADDISSENPQFLNKLGWGRINAFSAISCIPEVIALFSTKNEQTCPNTEVQFVDESVTDPTAWKWTFTGGLPSSSTNQHPKVTFATEGDHLVQLIAFKDGSSDTIFQSVKIAKPSISFSGELNVYNGSEVYSKVEMEGVGPFSFTYSDGVQNYSVSNVNSPYSLKLSPTQTTVYTPVSVTDKFCLGTVSGEITVNVESKSNIPCNFVVEEKHYVNGYSDFISTESQGEHVHLAKKIRPLGDLDGDGVNDLMIAAEGEHDDYRYASGALYILFMNGDKSIKRSQKLSYGVGGLGDGVDGGEYSFRGIGTDFDTIGDFNGDGVNDIVISSYFSYEDPMNSTGTLHLVYLNTDGTVKGSSKISPRQGAPNFPWENNMNLGYHLTCVGDIDGDGTVDLIAEGKQSGEAKAFVMFLNPDGTLKGHNIIESEDFVNKNSFDFVTVYNDFKVRPIGDLDQDGVPDVVFGNDRYDGRFVGKAFITFLNKDGSVKDYKVLTNGTWDIPLNLTLYSHFGMDFCVTPDLNNDGIQDLLVSAYYANGTGLVYLLYLNRDGSVNDYIAIGPGQSNFQGDYGSGDFGWSVAYLGDLDKDGTNEIAVGHHYQKPPNRIGSMWVLSLKPCEDCTANSNFSYQTACVNDPTKFHDESSIEDGKINYWYWDFGDNSSVTGIANPKHVYTEAGLYDVTLISGRMGDYPCTDTITTQVLIDSVFHIDYKNNFEVCSGEPAKMEIMQNYCGKFPYKYNWSPVTGVSDPFSDLPEITVSNSTTYYVEITDALGEITIDTVFIDVLKNCCKSLAGFTLDKREFCVDEELTVSNTSLQNGGNSFKWYTDGASSGYNESTVPAGLSYKKSGNYEIKLVVNDDCGTDTSSVFVTIVANPVIPVSVGDVVCSGSEIGMDNIPGFSFEWNTGEKSGKIIPSQSGEFKLVINNEFNCKDSVSLNIVLRTLKAEVKFGEEFLVLNDSITSYQWIDCSSGEVINGEIGKQFTPIKNGQYASLIKDIKGCTDTSDCSSYNLSATNLAYNNVFSLYPNPTGDNVNIEFGTEQGKVTIKVFNTIGQLISKSKVFNTSKITLNLPEKSGVYFVEVNNDKGIGKTMKVIKK